jgi:DcaP outer membrane protein
MKKALGMIAVSMLLAAPVLAADAPTFNCDYQPSCEVAPGIYGAMSSPVKSKFDLSIAGFVKLDYAYNSTNLGTNGVLLPNGPIPKTTSIAGREDQSVLSARNSRFAFKVAGPTFLGAKTNALIEADFFGGGNTNNEQGNLRMRHAYGSLDWTNTQVLFGQTNDIFAPMVPNLLDNRSGTATGTPQNFRVAQLRVTQKIPFDKDNSLKLVVGVMNPAQDTNLNTGAIGDTWGSVVNAAAQANFISNALGRAPGVGGFAMNPLIVGVFGLVGSEKVGLPVGVTGAPGVNFGQKALDSYGYGMYAFVPVLKSRDGKDRAMTMSFEGQAYMASNMNFNQATGNATTNVFSSSVVPPATLKNLAAAKGYGLAGQLIFYPTQDIGITGGYSRRNAYNCGSYSPVLGSYERTNELIYGNVTYDLNAAVRVGAEYEHQKTLYGRFSPGYNGDLGQDNTIRMAMYYFF